MSTEQAGGGPPEECDALFIALRESATTATSTDDDLIEVVARLLDRDAADLTPELLADSPDLAADVGRLCREAARLAEAELPTTPSGVYVAAEPLDAGTDALAAVMSGAIEARELPNDMVADDAVTDPAMVTGRSLTADVPQGAVLVLRDLSE